MTDLINLFPSLLLAMMVAITLILLPLLNDERPRRGEDRQRTTDKIRLKDK